MAVVAAATALAVPAAATGAVTVSIAGDTLTIVGTDADEDVTIGSAGSNSLGPTTDVSAGGQDMVAGAGCQGFGQANGPANDNSVFCPTNNFQRISATLGGGEDEFAAGNALPMTVDAGPGEDEVTTGPGPDVVLGGPDDDVLDLDTNNSAGTSSEVDGGPDDDELKIGRDSRATLVRGGEGRDTATYRFASGARTVTIDNVANDGGSGEGDDIRTDVEVVIGTGFADTFTGSGNGETLDGAGGTDRLTGLGGPDTLIGGPGPLDATFGGEGDDAIMLRDGEQDACPSGGPGSNTFDLDLIDQRRVFGLRLQLSCFFAVFQPGTPLTIADFGAVDEGPNVRMTVLRPAVGRAGVRVRLACPAVLRKPCAGPLRVFTLRGRQALATERYSVRPGRARIVVLELDGGRARPRWTRSRCGSSRSRRGPRSSGPRPRSGSSGPGVVSDDGAAPPPRGRGCARHRRRLGRAGARRGLRRPRAHREPRGPGRPGRRRERRPPPRRAGVRLPDQERLRRQAADRGPLSLARDRHG